MEPFVWRLAPTRGCCRAPMSNRHAKAATLAFASIQATIVGMVLQKNMVSVRLEMSRSIFAVCVCGLAVFAADWSVADDSVQFSRDVLPILSDRCFHCHGPDAEHREADLRLDQRESAVDDLAVVVPGDPDESELLARISSVDRDLFMPPPDSHRKPLTKAEIEILSDSGSPTGLPGANTGLSKNRSSQRSMPPKATLSMCWYVASSIKRDWHHPPQRNERL